MRIRLVDVCFFFFFFQAEDGIRDLTVTGVQTCALPIAPAAFILLLLVYNLCYMPTLGLANSLAFHHIQSQEQQFPLIRVFGTIGWIVAGLSIDFVLGPDRKSVV